MIRAKVHVPMHYNTFPAIQVDADDFVRKVEAKGLKARIVAVGASFEV
jgi:L-ascorbate metabolism protein UlaG (beta-lactamase superfamily)